MVSPAEDDLARFRYHTGASLRPPAPGERYPALFRDLGPAALARYLRGRLPRLAGPLTPLLYMRTLEYHEPYVDHEDIGRIVFLRPDEVGAWHAGIPHVYVARATRQTAPDGVGYVPPGTTLARAAALAAGARHAAELREALGGRAHDDARGAALARLDALNRELAQAEIAAEPLRRAFQAADPALRSAAREELGRLEIGEDDLCVAWHHLPRARRAELCERFAEVNLSRLGTRR
jgi:hypothetical protein